MKVLNVLKEFEVALAEFKHEEADLKSDAENSEKERTVDEMKLNLEATKLRIWEYVKINGWRLSLKDLVVDETNKMYKMTYTISLGWKEYIFPSYFKVINSLNNSYIKFQIPPGKTESAPDLTLDGKVYDVNVVKEKTKDIDIRIQYNEQKTLAKIFEKIDTFELKKNFDIKTDEKLQNTQITWLNNVKLWKEVVTLVEGGYYRSVFFSENGKYRELWKVYFDALWAVDKWKTQNSEFKMLDVTLKLIFDLSASSFKIENHEALVTKILLHRNMLKNLVESSSVGDPTVFEWLNRLGSTWSKTENIWLSLMDETYTIQWGKDKKDVLRFWFTWDKLSLKDLKWELVDSFVLPVLVGGKKKLYTIQQVDWKLQIVESKEKIFQIIKELPELSNAPKPFKDDNLYVYTDGLLKYFTTDGKLISSIPSSKTVTNEWKLETLAQDVYPYDIFKEYTDKEEDKKQFPSELLKKLNIFEYDLYAIFADLFNKSFSDWASVTKNSLIQRPVVRVAEWNNYKYYTVVQSKAPGPFVFAKDQELYDHAKSTIDIMSKNLKALETLSNAQLMYIDGKNKKNFLQFQWWTGWIGLLDVDTQSKLSFLKEPINAHKPLERKFVYSNWLLNASTDVEPLNFDITENNIALDLKAREYHVKIWWKDRIVFSDNVSVINGKKYKYRVEIDWKKFKVRKKAFKFNGDEKYEVVVEWQKRIIWRNDIDFKNKKQYDVMVDSKINTISRDALKLQNKIPYEVVIEWQKFQVTSSFENGKFVLLFDTVP